MESDIELRHYDLIFKYELCLNEFTKESTHKNYFKPEHQQNVLDRYIVDENSTEGPKTTFPFQSVTTHEIQNIINVINCATIKLYHKH